MTPRKRWQDHCSVLRRGESSLNPGRSYLSFARKKEIFLEQEVLLYEEDCLFEKTVRANSSSGSGTLITDLGHQAPCEVGSTGQGVMNPIDSLDTLSSCGNIQTEDQQRSKESVPTDVSRLAR